MFVTARPREWVCVWVNLDGSQVQSLELEEQVDDVEVEGAVLECIGWTGGGRRKGRVFVRAFVECTLGPRGQCLGLGGRQDAYVRC